MGLVQIFSLLQDKGHGMALLEKGVFLQDALGPTGFTSAKKELKITLVIFFPFLLIGGILIHLLKMPIRLVADVKNMLRDFLMRMKNE